MFIYILTESGASGPCKIGYALDVKKRLLGLTTGNYRQLIIRYSEKCTPGPEDDGRDYFRATAIEKAIHDRLDDYRIRGEWFAINWQDAIAIVSACIAENPEHQHAN